MKYHPLFVLLLILLGPSVVLANELVNTRVVEQTQGKIDQLHLGMDKLQVEEVLGAPQTKLNRGVSSRWNYRFSDNELTVWFGDQGLRNAHGAAFSTFHLVAPPAGYVAPEIYDSSKDRNRQVSVDTIEQVSDSEDESIFTPILPAQDIAQALERWRLGRESRRPQIHIANYMKDYAPSWGSHKQWLERVRKSMAKATFIKVGVSDVQTEFISSRKVQVNFIQQYRSNRYGDKVRKLLEFSYIDGQWLISKEQSLAKL